VLSGGEEQPPDEVVCAVDRCHDSVDSSHPTIEKRVIEDQRPGGFHPSANHHPLRLVGGDFGLAFGGLEARLGLRFKDRDPAGEYFRFGKRQASLLARAHKSRHGDERSWNAPREPGEI